MNKGQSAVVGAIVLAGAMFRGGSTTPSPDPFAGSRPPPVRAVSPKPAGGEGPWLASCKYWTAARWKRPLDTARPAELKTDTKVTSQSVPPIDLDDPTTDCEASGDRWGIPKLSSKDANEAPSTPAEDVHRLEIRTIIAVVPDPIHSHLALEFDRTIDSLMQAAADNSYLGSNYWLPWRSPRSPSASTEASPTETWTEEDRDREQQPGLIILKYSPQVDEPDLAWSSYHRVIYLFLVGESPAIGVNSVQLRNALHYEAILLNHYNAKLSMSDDATQLAVIGPGSSGSAASLREGIVNATFEEGDGSRDKFREVTHVIAAGTTSTPIAAEELNSSTAARSMTYYSFGENTGFEEKRLLDAFLDSHSDLRHTAILSEDNTVFGEVTSPRKGDVPRPDQDQPIYIRFPREISLLRNAQGEQTGKSTSSTGVPTPYLNLSLKDSSADDTVPQFSVTQTPLSQEAQLMAIAHHLQRARIEYILITASNILDELFLAQFLHRACPDARIVFYNGGDLLVERDIDNARYIGSITISPYDLTTPSRPLGAGRAFSDSLAEAIYNSASYIFWLGSKDPVKDPPRLAGYLHGENNNLQAPLWATAVGSDGYYPLGLLSGCASNSIRMLPSVSAGVPKECVAYDISSAQFLALPSPNAAPALSWSILCVLIAGLCVFHAAVVLSAQYWSPFTRDLAIHQNDQPRRRSVYINIGTSVLFCMSFVIASPMFMVLRVYRWDRGNLIVASVTLLAGIAAVLSTLRMTWPYLKYAPQRSSKYPTDLYFVFNLIALATLIIVPVLWVWVCVHDSTNGVTSHVGLFFSYRCLHPGSGVSPVIPILLLLVGWYMWSVFQTARLRFSTMNRPRLPDHVTAVSAYPLFVSDSQLSACRSPIHSCLFENISCLLITREILHRITRWSHKKLNVIFFLIYVCLFALCVFCGRIQSLERFLLSPGHRPTAYELLIAVLFFPLIMVVLTGWLRMIFIWGSLSRGLLEPLERMPIRVAFTRLKEVGWMTMLSQSSLHIRWRDMGRSVESIRQLINNDDLRKAINDNAKWDALKKAYDDLTLKINELREHIRLQKRSKNVPDVSMEHPADDFDLPLEKYRSDLSFIYSIEKRYAAFCELILSDLLVPYWDSKRVGFVEDDADDPGGEHPKPDADDPKDPLYIRLAEELLVIRYVALIRSVLVNIRYLMLFVSSAFVLAIIAWNSYPFQPHQLIDWCFTLLLVFLGIGFVWLLAQMHRNAILSRITDTKPNELGLDFYLRIVTFGAVPVLTWLAYQFPGVGGGLFKMLQPGLQVFK
jgi:hypothetical protein